MKKQNQKQKIEAIKDARSYVLNNWEGIMNQYDPDYIGCSTEGLQEISTWIPKTYYTSAVVLIFIVAKCYWYVDS